MLRQSRREFLATYAKAHPLPASFQRDEQVAIDMTRANMLLIYAAQHPETALPADYFNFMAQTPVRELSQHLGRSIIDNLLLANFVMGYQFRLASKGMLSTDPAEGPRLYQTATAELGDTRANNWAIERALRSSGNEEALAYQVEGYPSYYLIDRAGRMVEAYTSRPSDGARTVAAIEQALAR